MAEHWQVEGPRVIDVGGEQERVGKVVVAIVGGHVDVVTHDAHAEAGGSELPEGGPHGARVQVSSVHGLPLRVSWDGSTLKVAHTKETDESVLDALKRLIGSLGAPTAVITVSVPAGCRATISTLSASVLASGLRRGLIINTVSGEATVNDVGPTFALHTVSGAAECAELHGEAKISTVSGEVTVHASSVERATVNTVSGYVTLDLTQGRGTVRSSSVSGDVTVRAPLSGYAVAASTMSGQVVVDGQALARPADGGARQTRCGDEALVVKSNSVSGNLVVLRATPQDALSPQDATGPEAALQPDTDQPASPPQTPPWPPASPWSGQVDDPQGDRS